MEIILCVTGSIAAIETVKLARELKRHDIDVKCFMSDDACNIIHPYTMEFATGQKVILELTGEIEHVKHASADLILVAPATANVISKFAYKISDNPINALLITAAGQNTPIMMVPSMHDAMFQAVQENITKLEKEGIIFMDPRLEETKAKFPNLDDIVLKVLREISAADLKDKKVLISAGSTYEAIDPIRGITNRSSGKMGLEIAKEAYIRGANVTLLAGEMKVEVPKVIPVKNVLSAKEMASEIFDLIPEQDIFISAAAVADFSPQEYEDRKVSSSHSFKLELKTTPKIIKQVKKINPNIFLVGFKAEYDISTEELVDLSNKQIEETGSNMVVANDVSQEGAGFGSELNKVIIVENEVQQTDLISKREISQIIFNKIINKIEI